MLVSAAQTRWKSLAVKFLCVLPGATLEKPHRLAPRRSRGSRMVREQVEAGSEENSAVGGAESVLRPVDEGDLYGNCFKV